jgi:Bacterial membrane protein YfhO
MAMMLPGFQQFRFPSKLLTLASLAVAGLAGLGWDGATLGGRSRRPIRLASVGAGATLAVLAGVTFERGRLMAWFEGSKQMTLFGPLDPAATMLDIQLALIQGFLALATAVGLLILARRRLELAGALAVVLLSVDLAAVNSVYIKTAPQSDFERVPKVARLIAEAERLDPSPGPYRVHRMPVWNPISWQHAPSGDRIRDFVRWESDTLQPKYGLLHGVEYTMTIGVAELYDYSWFFSPFPRAARAEASRMLHVDPGYPVVVYPRRGFDLWNSRYFVLPAWPDWKSADRGFATFLPQTRPIYPAKEILNGDPATPEVKEWVEVEDFQILRNLDAYPRAWVVHEARFKPVISGLTRSTRKETMEEIVFANDAFWHDQTLTVFDPKRMAWLEVTDPSPLAGYLPSVPPQAGDSVNVVVEESGPQRTVLDATLARPGLVILAEVFYPGWKLTIDGEPAPIYRANRLMRGAAVKAGKHRLVYTYEPNSFKVGAAISLLGLVGLVWSSAWTLRRRTISPS